MKRTCLALILGLILIFTGCSSGMTGNSVRDDMIKIGVVTPLSGDASNYGEWTKEGLELALDEINAESRKIELIYEDGQCNPKPSTDAINKLINIDNVKAVIGEVCSSATLAMAPIAEENHVVLMSTASSSPLITDAGDYIFRNWPSDTFEAGSMAAFANERGYGSAAVLYVNNDYGNGLKEIFSQDFDGEILAAESYEQESADFRVQLTKIMRRNPEALYVGGYTNEIARILVQAKELGLEAQILSVVSVESEKTIEVAGESAEGVFYTYPKFDLEDESIQGFRAAFNAKYGKDPEIFASTAYDALKILALAMEEGADSIKDSLYLVQGYPGVSGQTSFDENGDVPKPSDIKVIKNGKFEKVS